MRNIALGAVLAGALAGSLLAGGLTQPRLPSSRAASFASSVQTSARGATAGGLTQPRLPSSRAASFASSVQTSARGATSDADSPVRSMERKLDYIEANGARKQPNLQPTQLTEEEVNAYFAAGRVKLPRGVHRVHFVGQSGQVTATSEVDFDEIKEGRGSMNPLLAMFGGTHNVKVVAEAAGRRGRGSVHVLTVEIDGVEVPRMALQFFADRYLKPKYPNVGLDSSFDLPDRVDTAAVGNHVLTVAQR
jgi:hypothetical protein